MAAQDQRPYGQGAADLEDARTRRQAAQSTASARPRMSPRNQDLTSGGGETNPGHMDNPPQDQPPRDNSALAGQQRRGLPTDPPPVDWPIDTSRHQHASDAFAEGLDKRAATVESWWNTVARQAREVATSVGEFAKGGKEAARITPNPGESKEDYQKRFAASSEQSAGKARSVIGGVVGLAGDPYTLTAGTIIEAQVANDPNLRDDYAKAIADLPPDQQKDAGIRSELAHQMIDREAATLLRALDDPNVSDDQKRAAFVVAGGLIIERVAEFGGPQALRSLTRIGVRVSSAAASKAGSAIAEAARPKTLAHALSDEELARAQGIAMRLRAIGLKAEADTFAAETKAAPERAIDPAPKKSAAQLAYEKRVAESKAAGTYDPENPISFGDDPKRRTTASEGPTLDELATGPRGVQARGVPKSGVGKTKAARTAAAPLQTAPSAPTEVPPSERPMVMPSEENLGVPKGLMDSLPENLRKYIVDEAQADYQGIQDARGGTVPRAQVDRESERIFIDAGLLAQTASRTPVTAPGMRALMRATRRVAEERAAIEAEAAKLGPTGLNDEIRARFAVKVFEQNSLQRVMAGARAEWGRTGQAMQDAVASGDNVRLNNTYASIIKALGGKENVDKVMERLAAIRNNPELMGNPYARDVAAFKYVNALGDATKWQKADEIFFNSVLGIPHTHVGIIIGQLVFNEVEAFAKLGGAGVNALVSAGTLGRVARQKTFTKALAEWAGSHIGVASGLKAARVYLTTGVRRDSLATFIDTGTFRAGHALKDVGPRVKIGPVETQIAPIGSLINVPTRLIDTYTVAFHEMGRQRSLWGQVVAAVEKEMPGKSILNAEFRHRVGEHLTNPTSAMEEIATQEGRRASLRGQPKNKVADWLREGRDLEFPPNTPVIGGFAPARRFVPFINIGFNLTSIGMEYSPLGFLRVLSNDSVEQKSEAVARAAIGSLLFWHLASKAGAGELTGPMPTDPNERALWQRDGKQAYSYKQGDQWIPYDRILGPLATPAKWVTGLTEAFQEAQGKPLTKELVGLTAWKAAQSMFEPLLDSTSFLGVNQLFQAGSKITTDPGGAIGNLAGQQVASQLPYGGTMRTIAQSTDPTVRKTRGFKEEIEAVIPGLSTQLPPVMDAYGRPVQRQPGQQGLSGVFSPIRGTTESRDPVDAELAKHSIPSFDPTLSPTEAVKQIFPHMAQKEIATFKLNGEEGAMLQTLAGRAAYQGLSDLFADKAPYNGQPFSKLSEPDKVKAIQKAFAEAGRTARAATADAIMQSARTAPEVARAADMRIAGLGARYQRALYLEAISRLDKWSPQASKLVNDMLQTRYKGQPTVSEYLRAAPVVRQYLAAHPFDQGNSAEWALLEQQRKDYAAIVARDRLDNTKNADAFLKAHPLLRKYQGASIGRERQRIRDRNPWVVPYLSGTEYTQE